MSRFPKRKEVRMPVAPLAYSFDDAALAAGAVSPAFLRLEWRRGNLATVQVGRRRLILADELRRWLQGQG
jgi:hypothetical protein